MAYAESTIGGTYGNSFRVWVNSIRTYDGSPAENFEEWRVEGGINRVSATGNPIWSDGASYTTQLGLNGVAVSSGFTYNFDTTLGTKVSWGSGATRVYRDAAGNGFGFTSRTDVNLNNAAGGLTTGWVASSDGLITRYRHASLSALSPDQGGIPFTDEGPAWVENYNPGGAAVDAFIEINGSRVYTSGSGIGGHFDYPFDATLSAAIQAASPNSNAYTVRIGVHDNVGGDSWDYRDRTGTIKNDTGQADPTFANFSYLDTNPTTVAVTGSDQVLIQNRSTLQATVSTANKASANKLATMSSYTFLIGAYSQSAPWSNTAAVVQNVGTVNVTGTQNLSVRAVDSRGNSKTVTKPVTVLPYSLPIWYQAMTVKYVNDFDATGGLTVSLLSGTTLGAIAPMPLNGVNKNSVNATSGVQWDISKGNNTSYSGTWKNIASTTAANGYINISPTTLATDILNAMNVLGADNTVRYYIKFKITDVLDSNTFETYIDIGRPIFRIGTDNVLYYREFPLSNPVVLSNTSAASITPDVALSGTFKFTALAGPITINAPINPFDGKRIMFIFKDNGTARGITWNAIFKNVGANMPLATIPNKTVVVGAIYDAAETKWHIVAVSQEA